MILCSWSSAVAMQAFCFCFMLACVCTVHIMQAYITVKVLAL